MQGNQKDDDIIWIIIAVIALLLGGMFAMSYYHKEILYVIWKIKKYESIMFFFDPEWKNVDTFFAQSNPAELTAGQIAGMYNHWLRWIWTPILLAIAYYCYNIPSFRQKYAPQILLEKQQDVFPTIIPFVERDIMKEKNNSGNWRFADTPLLFLVRNRCLYTAFGTPFRISQACECEEADIFYNKKQPVKRIKLSSREAKALKNDDDGKLAIVETSLLAAEGNERFEKYSLIPLDDSIYLGKNNYLDENSLRELLVQQIGPRIEGNPFSFLKKQTENGKNGDYLYHLGVALYASGHSEAGKGPGYEIISDMARCFEGKKPWKDIVIFSAASDKFLKKNPPENCRFYMDEILPKHGYYLYPFLMALFFRARSYGVLPSAWFNWLRYYDRTAWYSLAQCGGRCAWVEGLGAWCHYHAEEIVEEPAVMLPYVEGGIRGLKAEMANEGWLYPAE